MTTFHFPNPFDSRAKFSHMGLKKMIKMITVVRKFMRPFCNSLIWFVFVSLSVNAWATGIM